MMTIVELVRRVQECLSPDLLKKNYLSRNRDNPLFGHCYVASEALYHLLGDSRFKPHYGRDANGTHWWLQDEVGNILDPTADQYKLSRPPYENGRRCGFLTKHPSKRARVVIERVKNKLMS